jgi:peptide/nickel transport system substrate-binding protein
MRKRALFIGVAVALLMPFSFALGNSTATASSPHPLVLAATVESSVAQNFNPFSPTSPLSDEGLAAVSLIYEPLLQFNVIKGVVIPWLATKYTWSNGGKDITFTTRPGVTWSDGTPFTAADVAFTYNLTKHNPALNYEGLDLLSVSSTANTVTLGFPSPQFQNLQQIASVFIVPQHIWSKVVNVSTFTDPNPVGTGPFVLKAFAPQDIILAANPHYWQPGLPKVPVVDMPVYTSDAALAGAIESGQVQWAADFIPDIQKLYLSKSKYYHFYGPPLDALAIYPNLTTWPTNQLAVRQAISLAINRKQWVALGESGQAGVISSASGLPVNFAPFITANVKNMTETENIAKARSILTAAGFVLGKNGYFQTKSGRTLAVTISDPTAFSDVAEECELMVQSARQAGIDVTFQGQSVAGWRANVAEGNFQLTEYWEILGPAFSPYKLYNTIVNSALTAPIGQAAAGDFERLRSAAIDADLAKLAAANSTSAELAALAPIEQYVATELPVIPTFASDMFDQYSTQYYTGWPDANNPYILGIPWSLTNEVTLLHLTPVS